MLIMDINNVIKINDIVSRYNENKERYNKIIEALFDMKDKIVDLEIERDSLFTDLINIRLEEVNFLNEIKNNSPEEYNELMHKIQKTVIAQDR